MRRCRRSRLRSSANPSAGDLWRIAWPTAIAIGAGMVLVPTALLTLAHPRAGLLPAGAATSRPPCSCSRSPASPSRPPRSRTRWCSPARWCSSGPRSASAPPRWRGPGSCSSPPPTGRQPVSSGRSPSSTASRDAVVLLQIYAASSLFGALALAFAAPGARHRRRRAAPARERFRRTFHDSPVAMAVTTLDGRIVETNRALCQLLATPDHALVGTELEALRADDSGEHELPRPGASEALRAGDPTGQRAGQRRVGRGQRVGPAARRHHHSAPSRRPARRHRAHQPPAAAAAGAEDGVGGPPRRRHRPRLQQRAVGDARAGRAAAGRPRGARVGAGAHRLRAARHRPRRRAHRRPHGVQPPTRRTRAVRRARAAARRAGAVPPGARGRGHARARPRRQPAPRSSPIPTASSRPCSTSW